MNIYICEDSIEQLNHVKKIISNYIMIEQLDMTLALATTNPYELLEKVDQSNDIGIYFLDIDLSSDINGVQLAQKIREKDALGHIIFITSHSELSYLTFKYKVSALDFIIKDDIAMLDHSIRECIDVCQKRLSAVIEREKVDKLEIKSGSQKLFINYDDIIFFESSPNPHRIILHLKHRRLEFYGNLKEYDDLDERFFRCHQSYIINIEHITSIDKKNRLVHFINGETCYISSRKINKIPTIN
ncbi:LytR/AlgR family response regulator transcription factor [Macrococcoides caseolyticum]|uniref:LytR/AlgR family response regulator transcription factor n=1 Tax=Macrococcoides caseolyticum TaxID=69966 RepID=UPI001F1A3ABC|nr:LytTR family DNA-binding domain-containing protein [Macrococcus caseolyticus]MCE4956622.1 response regulator transcription factor [Macrococcus caseolyticus]